jgi:hypothetical protein
MGDRTVSEIVNEVSTAIWDIMQPLYLPESTREMWEQIAMAFEQRWHFPHCVGAMDGKHIVIKNPEKSGCSFFNYKHTFSVVLLAVVDFNYKFTIIDVGSMGRFSDGSIFSTSVLGKKLNKQSLEFPPPALMPNFEQPLPYVFVGDEAFPLSENLMSLYPKRSVTGKYENKVFNYSLSRARQTVECSFGILASRFRVFRKLFEIKVDSVDKVIKAACVLHNYLRHNTLPEDNVDNDIVKMPENQLLPLTHNKNRSASSAFIVRHKFTDYFNTVGSVPWQADKVSRGNY